MIFCMIPRVFKDIKLDHETVMSLDSWCISPYQAFLPWDIKVCFNLFSIPNKYNTEDQHESASAFTATGHRDSNYFIPSTLTVYFQIRQVPKSPRDI